MSLNPQDVMDAIVNEQYYVFPGTTMTVCCLTLSTSEGGVSVVGYGDCIDPNEFDAKKGRDAAKKRAVDEVFGIIGIHLKLGGSL